MKTLSIPLENTGNINNINTGGISLDLARYLWLSVDLIDKQGNLIDKQGWWELLGRFLLSLGLGLSLAGNFILICGREVNLSTYLSFGQKIVT